MARRIDIELTSQRPDGSWTWRAPGARQPRGDVAGAVVPADAKVGDVLRADAEFELEGIVVTAVVGTRAAARPVDEGARIEVIGTRRDGGGVSVVLAPGSRQPPPDDDRRRRRPDLPSADGPQRRPRRGAAEGGRERGPRRERGTENRAGRAGGTEAGAGAHLDRLLGAEDRTERQPRRDDTRGPRQRAGARPDRPARPERGSRSPRLQPSATYRNAALADLRPEQLPVAEQLLRGGIPALRSAIEEQNARARSEGHDPVPPEPLLAMAEELLPKMNLATWMDRATAVRGAGREAPLREVRSVVAGASAVGLDDEARTLLAALRQSLEERVTALRQAWLGRITGALDQNRVTEALQVASRPPEPAARIPADLAVRLATEAGATMNPDLPEAQWLALLEAVVASPVRRTVKPVGLPQPTSEELLHAVHRAAGLVPELARLLGLPIPPPPGPRRPSVVGARRA